MSQIQYQQTAYTASSVVVFKKQEKFTAVYRIWQQILQSNTYEANAA